jgi:hypothetical protein
VDGAKQEISDLGQLQAGATLGGALKKNKLLGLGRISEKCF